MHRKNSLKKRLIGNKNILLFFSILAVVAVSGCISLGDLFGSGETKVEAPSDVMSFSDSTVIPNPPILTGDTFTTSFAMKNLDEFEDAKNVKVELYDWGVCAPSSCSPSSWGIDGKKTSYSVAFNDIFPKDVQQIECQFKSPSSERIGGMPARCPIRYKLTYDFSGITTTDLNVISNKKFQELSRAGQVPTVTSVQSKSRGPIKVDFSFGVNQPVRTSGVSVTVKIGTETRTLSTGSSVTIGSAEIEFVGIKNNKAIFKVNKAETECAFGENINCNGIALSITKNDNAVKIPMYVRVENKGSGKTKLNEVLSVPSAKVKINNKEYTLTKNTIDIIDGNKYTLFSVNNHAKAALEVNNKLIREDYPVPYTFEDDIYNDIKDGVFDIKNDIFTVKTIDVKNGKINVVYDNKNVDIKINEVKEITVNSKNYKLKLVSIDPYSLDIGGGKEGIKVGISDKKITLDGKDIPFELINFDTGGSLLSGGLVVKIPAALASSGACSGIICDGFSSASEETDSCKLTLTKKVDFVKDKSQVFRCELTSPSDSVVSEQKVYSIQSEVKYTYQIDNDFNVAIRPMAFG